MTKDIIITSYNAPDLDGVSSMYAYSEYLNKIGENANYYISDIPKKEVSVVCNIFDITLHGINSINDESVVIVDTNFLEEIPKIVNKNNIIEIIDHHVRNESHIFPNAKIHIELIGAVATLIAEKYYISNIPISRNSAILLYYGIISNSINLKSSITTEKDIDMANWLKSQCKEISEEKIETIFREKSRNWK